MTLKSKLNPLSLRKRSRQTRGSRLLAVEQIEARLMLAAATLHSPVPGSNLASTDVTFNWSDEGNVRYIVELGTTVSGSDIHNSGFITTTSYTVNDVPTDSKVHLRLWTETATGTGFFYTRNYTFTSDVDVDGIDDEIDAQPGVHNAPRVLNGSDHTLTVLGSERVAGMEVSQSVFDSLADGISGTEMREMTQRVYEHFDDDFDFILFTSYQDTYSGYAGIHYSVKNDTQGTGTNLFDSTSNYGSDGNLQSAIHLKRTGMLEGGPSLHEITHRWANHLDSAVTSVSGHWGYSSANGQLGGWDPASFEDLGNDTYRVDSFGQVANGGNSLGYSEIELYLMGLIPPAQVPDLQIANNVTNASSANSKITFNAESITTRTINDIIATDGARVPDHNNSQKDFKSLHVVVTSAPLSFPQWVSLDSEVYRFELNGDNGISSYNFFEATGGRATMEFGNLFASLNTVDTTSPTVTDISINTGITDPADLAKGEQPTSWEEQRSDIRTIVVTFSESVQLTVDDLRLTNLGIDAPNDADVEVQLDAQHLSLDANILTISFSAEELDEGVYQLEILPTTTDAFGNALDGNSDGTGGDAHVFSGNDTNLFYKLTADWNGDEGVSVFDFTTFSYWFGQSTIVAPFAPEYADLSSDNGISVFDFTGFSNNFGDGVIFEQTLVANTIGNKEESVDVEVLQEEQIVTALIDDRRLILDAIPRRRTEASLDEDDWETHDHDLESVIDVLAEAVSQAG